MKLNCAGGPMRRLTWSRVKANNASLVILRRLSPILVLPAVVSSNEVSSTLRNSISRLRLEERCARAGCPGTTRGFVERHSRTPQYAGIDEDSDFIPLSDGFFGIGPILRIRLAQCGGSAVKSNRRYCGCPLHLHKGPVSRFPWARLCRDR